MTVISEGKCAEAVTFYTKAIECNPNNAIYFANRSAGSSIASVYSTEPIVAHCKWGNYGLAIDDASHSISIYPTYMKAYYRRATANIERNKWEEAIPDLQLVFTSFNFIAKVI